MRRRIARVSAIATVLLVLGTAPALAAGGPPPGKGGGGGETDTLGNNLSVPTVFVPSQTGAPALRIACGTAPVAATGPTSTYDGIAYYLQKTEATWSATCATATSASVTAKWGDNLLGGMTFASGKPIRVEMGLLGADTGTGFAVVNLTPDLDDRNSTYGTDGAVTTMSSRVWDSGAHLRIVSSTGSVVFDGPMVAEINATGGVVYGFNWGIRSKGTSLYPTSPGTYTLTFTTSDAVTITDSPAGEGGTVVFSDHASSVTVVIGTKSGGR